MGEVTRNELNDIRKELRELRLLAGAFAEYLDKRDSRGADVWILNYRWKVEAPIGKCRPGHPPFPSRAQQRLGEALGQAIPTLQDLTLIPREQVAAVKGVGPRAMQLIDQAMAEHGLSYAEPEKAGAV